MDRRQDHMDGLQNLRKRTSAWAGMIAIGLLMLLGLGAATPAGADVIGANCGQGIAGFAAIGKRLRAATDRPIWLKPNAGLPQFVDGRAVYATTPEEFVAHVPELIKAGASFIGGCCGSSPAFIQAIVRCLPG